MDKIYELLNRSSLSLKEKREIVNAIIELYFQNYKNIDKKNIVSEETNDDAKLKIYE
jgi:hypothetical protein